MRILGIDIGGSGIKGAIVDTETGELVSERTRFDTPKNGRPAEIGQALRELKEALEWTGPIGCGFPAVIQKGVALTASNVNPEFIGTNVDRLFSEICGSAVRVSNDTDVAGLGESVFGAGKGFPGLSILITFGTGIGSAFVLDGKLISNTELGHIEFHGDVAEKYAADSVRKHKDLSWKKWGRRVNDYLLYIHRLFYPDQFIIGGGVSRKLDRFESELDLPCPVIPAVLRNNAGIIGAALSLENSMKSSPTQ